MDGRLNLSIPKQLADALRMLSEKDGRSVPELARSALIDFVEKRKQ
jgi:Ribbon-helix-helix protein, copG family